jgi:putative protein kinase ArgK-like GTPase of G3E family
MASNTEAMRFRRPWSEQELLEQFMEGKTLALARVISLVENEAPGYRKLLSSLYNC